MIRKKAEIEFEPWIDEVQRSLITSFATGIGSILQAILHSATTNGEKEGGEEDLTLPAGGTAGAVPGPLGGTACR
jgi:hypothetical protein